MANSLDYKKTASVVFGQSFPGRNISSRQCKTVVAYKKLEAEIEDHGYNFVDIEPLITPASVYKTSDFLEELSELKLSDGTRISKWFLYKGFELWWINYNNLFQYFAMPYIKYQNLLKFLSSFEHVTLHNAPNQKLFECYFRAYNVHAVFARDKVHKKPLFLPFGMILQILFTIIFIPFLAILRAPVLVFTGDKFDKGRDYDFRLVYIYEELRKRNLHFTEFIRSLESWRSLIANAFKRKRSVVYPEAITIVARMISVITGGRRKAKNKLQNMERMSEVSKESRFRYLIAVQYLHTIYDDILAIRIMRGILKVIRVKAAFIPTANERNFHTVIACKLNNIPTVGILHGVSLRYATPYDFLPKFDGKKMLSVDVYGVWSNWWKEYFISESRAYSPEQIHVSGPMRPLKRTETIQRISKDSKVRVLFVAEQTVESHETLPYLQTLIEANNIDLTIKFRPYRDGFEEWIRKHKPEILTSKNIKIVKGSMQDAIKDADVVVGCHSTGVLEALLQLKVPIFLQSLKWGDYYSMSKSEETKKLFAKDPDELITLIKATGSISEGFLQKLQEQYFGNPHKNGSAWVVDRIEEYLTRSKG